MSSLPQALVHFRTELEDAIGREQARRRASHRRTRFVVLAVSAIAGAAILALSLGTPWADSPGFLAKAQAALTPPPGAVLGPGGIASPGRAFLRLHVVVRFLAYEYLPRTAENLALTDIRAQHPNATGP